MVHQLSDRLSMRNCALCQACDESTDDVTLFCTGLHHLPRAEYNRVMLPRN